VFLLKTKAKSVQTFKVRLWSRIHYKEPVSPKYAINVFNGTLNFGNEKEIHFHSPGELLTAIQDMYLEAERKKKVSP